MIIKTKICVFQRQLIMLPAVTRARILLAWCIIQGHRAIFLDLKALAKLATCSAISPNAPTEFFLSVDISGDDLLPLIEVQQGILIYYNFMAMKRQTMLPQLKHDLVCQL